MNGNPYSPPQARVEDVSPQRAPRDRPRQIVTALKLAVIGYALGLLAIALSWDYYSTLQSPLELILSQAFSLAIFVWIYYKIYVGRNWARVTLLVFSVLGGLFTLSSVFMNILAAAPMLAKAQMLIGLVLNIAVLWLLFSSPGREWFRKGPQKALA